MEYAHKNSWKILNNLSASSIYSYIRKENVIQISGTRKHFVVDSVLEANFGIVRSLYKYMRLNA